MTRQDRTFILAEILSVVIVIATGLLCGLQHPWSTWGYGCLVWVVAALVYQATPWRNPAGWWVLLGAWTLLMVGVEINTAWFTVHAGGTDAEPVLANFDARRAWNDGCDWLAGTAPRADAPLKDCFYGMLVSMIWRVTGVTIVTPLMVNALAILITVILTGGIAVRLLSGRVGWNARRIASVAMASVALVCYLMAQGMVLIKESLVIMTVAVLGYMLTTLRRDMPPVRHSWMVWAAFAVSAALLPGLRMYVAVMTVAALPFMTSWRNPQLRRRALIVAGWMMVWIVAIWYMHHLSPSLNPSVSQFNHYTNTARPDQSVWYSVINDYQDWPEIYRLIWLPVNALTQFLIPFPWHWTAQLDYGPSQVYAHMAWPWYAMGALLLYYFCVAWRRSPGMLKRFTAWALIMWLVPAWVVAGTVSRYGLAMIPLAVPAVVYVLALYRDRVSLRWWIVAYFTLLCVGLLVCHHLMSIN